MKTGTPTWIDLLEIEQDGNAIFILCVKFIHIVHHILLIVGSKHTAENIVTIRFGVRRQEQDHPKHGGLM
jgi:hypothetical protein